MNRNKKEIEFLYQEIEKYNIILSDINNRKYNVYNVNLNLINAKKNFDLGAYIDSDGTIDRGELKNCISILEDVILDLNDLSVKVENYISELKKKIISLS